MFKKLISKLYHKYVLPMGSVGDIELDEYLEWSKEVYHIAKLYEIKTHEEYSAMCKVLLMYLRARKVD